MGALDWVPSVPGGTPAGVDLTSGARPEPGEAIVGTIPLPPPPAGTPLHLSYGETYERHYERAREAGIPAGNAREIATEAATRNHRTWERNRRDR